MSSESPMITVVQLGARWLLSRLLVLGGVGRAAAARAERDIGAAQPTPAARPPRNPCVETENRSEVKSQVSVYVELWRLDPALIMDGGSED